MRKIIQVGIIFIIFGVVFSVSREAQARVVYQPETQRGLFEFPTDLTYLNGSYSGYATYWYYTATESGLVASTTFYVLTPPDQGLVSRVVILIYDLTQGGYACDNDWGNSDINIAYPLITTRGFYSMDCRTADQKFINTGDSLRFEVYNFSDGGYTVGHPLNLGGDGFFASSSRVMPWFYAGTSESPYNWNNGYIPSNITDINRLISEAMHRSFLDVQGSCMPFASSSNLLGFTWSGTFNIGDCLAGLIYPGNEAINDDMTIIRMTPPWGYVFRLYDILNSTSSSSSIPVLNATIPPGIPGAGAELTIDMNHSLDYILNATTSSFLTSQASSTETFYTVTARYWNIFVYLGLGYYILRRLLGSNLIPSVGGFGSRGFLSDTSSSDDSYKLKEWLYNHRK